MGKIIVTIVGLVLYTLLPFLGSKDTLAQLPQLPGQPSTQSCASKGITFTPSAFPENYPGSLTFNFRIDNSNILQNLTRDGGKRVWMHFNEFDSNQVTVTGSTFTLTLPEDARARSIDPHSGSLHWQPDSTSSRTEEFCSEVNYRIGTGNTRCNLLNLPATIQPAPGNNFDLQFEAPADRQYDLRVNSQILDTANSDHYGRGVFRNVSIPGRNDERVYVAITAHRGSAVSCNAYTTITATAPPISSTNPSTPARAKCDIIQMPNSDHPGLWATNLQGSTAYKATLDGNVIAIPSTGAGETKLTIDLGVKPSVGDHPVTLLQLPQGAPAQEACTVTLHINPDGGTTISTPPAPGGPGGPNPSATPCTGANCTKAGGESCDNNGFKTAIGCIHTDPAGLVKDVMTFIIGISGGLAFLMMLLGAFQMLTSAGNPETLAAGKDRFTSAIIGLLFVIFAVLLLQIIGFDILRLPGFGR